MQLYRIASFDYKIYSGVGAAIIGGRWNSVGKDVIYTALSLAGAKLELLAHIGFKCVPRNYGFVEIFVPNVVSVVKYPRSVPSKMITSQSWGDKWLSEEKSAIALVPSAASPGERIAMINPNHHQFPQILVSNEMKVNWDKRHFAP